MYVEQYREMYIRDRSKSDLLRVLRSMRAQRLSCVRNARRAYAGDLINQHIASP